LIKQCIAFIGLSLFAAHAPAAEIQLTADPVHGLQKLSSSADRPYVVYVDAEPREDITFKIQNAIDRVGTGYGGNVVLPPGTFRLTNAVNLAGSVERFPKSGARGVVLRGASGLATRLTWHGPPEGTMIELSAPWGCEVSQLHLDGRNVPGVKGVVYHGGYDRWVNGGKNNTFKHLMIENVDVGLVVGDLFGPDLVGSSFYGVHVNHARIGIQVLAANVTGMGFYNIVLEDYTEAGFKLLGFSGRRIRKSPDSPPPEKGSAVLMDADGRREIFADEVPPYIHERKSWKNDRGESIVGGGANDTSIFGATGRTDHREAWFIDAFVSNVRVYTGDISGAGGVYRNTWRAPYGRFSDLLVDVSVHTSKGVERNAIELAGQGPFYFIGGHYDRNVVLRGNVFAHGTTFSDGASFTRTGNNRPPVVHRPAARMSFIVSVPSGANEVTVHLQRPQPDLDYQVIATPRFDAGGIWVEEKRVRSFSLHLAKASEVEGVVDVLVQHQGKE